MTENFEAARRNMVLTQLRPNNVTSDSVADAMDTVPREIFVPENLQGVAYMDEDLEVAAGRYLIEPRVFARVLQAAAVKDTDVVLDVACGTGYTSAVLGRLAQAVVAVESDEALVEKASEILTSIEADNVAVIQADLTAGNEKQGPYNVIHINGAVDEVPEALFAQLQEGGRLVCVMGHNPGVATLYVKENGTVFKKALFDAIVPELNEMKKAAGFSF
ncbi:methyltransferase domain-containing protein [Sneathiella sp. P13V-1]|uniref:protein-L-isoaspartate O-methyltransferase family protein n=1 Tax=Sneathiella sp. P13V-1 TaxID=2697366 RepID=UPI00187B5068|nr:protein-L-isoaspartate O-methyltransferase [Sneathiella sp. P13V-1]MBE7637094.1 methyltransferase domain-containing protein [Sneathiella sp. P13V-1]